MLHPILALVILDGLDKCVTLHNVTVKITPIALYAVLEEHVFHQIHVNAQVDIFKIAPFQFVIPLMPLLPQYVLEEVLARNLMNVNVIRDHLVHNVSL